MGKHPAANAFVQSCKRWVISSAAISSSRRRSLRFKALDDARARLDEDIEELVDGRSRTRRTA